MQGAGGGLGPLLHRDGHHSDLGVVPGGLLQKGHLPHTGRTVGAPEIDDADLGWLGGKTDKTVLTAQLEVQGSIAGRRAGYACQGTQQECRATPLTDRWRHRLSLMPA